MTDTQPARTIPNNAGDINERLMRRFGMTDLGRIESAHRSIKIDLYSPEAKRSFMRMFHPMQINVHFITSIARMGLPSDMVEKAESDLRVMLDTVTATMDKGIARIEKKLQQNGIRELAKYHLPPVSQDVPVFSGLGRRYLDLIARFDHLMLMVETLAWDEAINNTEATLLKTEFKKPIRSVAQAARLVRNRLHRAFRDREGAADDQAVARDGTDAIDEPAAMGEGRDGPDGAQFASSPDGTELASDPPAAAHDHGLVEQAAGAPD